MLLKPPLEPNYPLVFVLLILILAGTTPITAQEIVTNDDGERIVQFADGSWRYFEMSDSALLKPVTSLEVPDQGPGVFNYRTFQRYTVAAVRYESEMMDRLEITQQQYDLLKDDFLNAELNEDTLLASTSKSEMEKLEVQLENERRIVAYSRNLIKKILKIGKREKYHKLAKVYVPGFNNKDDLAWDQDQYSELESSFNEINLVKPREARDQEILAAEISRSLDVNAGTTTPGNKLNSDDIGPTAGMAMDNKESARKNASLLRKTPQKPWSSRPNMVTEYTCDFGFNGKDPFTGQSRMELEEELWFTFTDPRLRSYLKNRPYLSCASYISSVDGGFRYLTLTFQISSRTARQEYGYIPNGSLLNVKLMNGKTVSLFSQSESHGIADASKGITTYKVKYPVDYQKEKQLLKSEVDFVRVIWSTGYEDYEVHNVDLVKNQLTCLNNL